MKKTYKTPLARVVTINTSDLMATSDIAICSDEEANENYTGGGDVKNDKAFGNLWDNLW